MCRHCAEWEMVSAMSPPRIRIHQAFLLVLLSTSFITFYVLSILGNEKLLYQPENFNSSLYPLDINLEKIVYEKLTMGVEISVPSINQHPFKYIHDQHTCKFNKSEKKINLLILVKSTAKNCEFRHTIRSTWGQVPDQLLQNIRIIFMLGRDPEIQKLVDFESQTFNDIIQEDFIDAYKNNTFKTIMSFNWAVNKCNETDFLLFVDDDIFVNVKGMYHHLASIPVSDRTDLLFGLLNTKEKPERDKGSKYYVPVETYRFKKYPPYLAGGAYATTMSAAVKIHVAFPYVKSYWVDDVYLGIVANKLNITPKDDPKFHFQNKNVWIGDILVSHREIHKPEDMVNVWKMDA